MVFSRKMLIPCPKETIFVNHFPLISIDLTANHPPVRWLTAKSELHWHTQLLCAIHCSCGVPMQLGLWASMRLWIWVKYKDLTGLPNPGNDGLI